MDDVLEKFELLKASGFIERWQEHAERAAQRQNLDLPSVLASINKQTIGQWAQDFWEILPDSEIIHTPGFYALCDIAEWWCDQD